MFNRTHPGAGSLRLAALFVVLITLFSAVQRSQAVDPPPSPIDPTSGQQNLLDLVKSLPINGIQSALDHFPVPYVVCASAGTATATCVNNKAGSPQRLDADKSKVTGKGGDDIQVEVNTELLPTPHLRVNINRITSPTDATNVKVVVAFPFAAFNGEPTLPAPNLFLGYQTTAANGAVGGKAPLTEEFRLIPDILAGTSHNFTLTMLTSGQVNPMTFQAGHFDGTTASGIQNAIGIQAYVEGAAPVVPDSIAMTISMNENAIGVPLTNTGLSLNWTASSRAKVTFNYLENETFPFPPSLDYTTALTFDQMPTNETITLSLNEATRQLHLTHTANSVIGTITLNHTRADGLRIIGTATDVPTSVDLAVDLNGGNVTLNVNANTLDLDIKAIQTGGFANTANFLGYNIGYAEVFLKNAPDLFAGYDPVTKSFGVHAINAGESIGAIGVIIGDDDVLELPSHWANQNWHVFSLIDTGLHGTAAARIIDLQNATLTLDASPTGETFQFALGSRSPLQLHLETAPASALTHKDILAVCEVVNMPMGTDVDFTIDFPDQFSISAVPDNTQVIDSLTCAGHVGTLNFELGVGHLPMSSGYKFDSNGKLEVKVEPTGPNSDFIGFITVRLYDNTNPLPSPLTLPSLFGAAALHDARMRSDHIPSFVGTWSDSPATVYSFDTGIPSAAVVKYLGGVQVAVSTATGGLLPALAAAVAGSHDFLTFTDTGAGGATTLKAGAFGIDSFSYSSTEATHAVELHYKADAPHILDVKFDTRFGGKFYPEFDTNLTLTVDAIPATWDLTTNFSTALDYTASAGLTKITLVGDLLSKELIGDGGNATFTGTTLKDTDSPFGDNWAGGIVYAASSKANVASNVPDELTTSVWAPAVPAAATPYFIAAKTHIDFLASGLPTHVVYALDASVEGSATLNMSNPITQVRLELTSDLRIFGKPYKHMLFEVNNIPADWGAKWGLLPNPHASLSTSSPLGAVKVILSRDTLANEAAQYGPFTTAGGNVSYTPFAREIDRRYFRQGAGDDPTRETTFMSRLDGLYNSTTALGSGGDHLIMRKNAAGDMSFLSVQGTGFQCAAVQFGPGSLQCVAKTVNAGEINASLALNFPVDHPFYVGLENEPGKFTTVDVPNIPDSVSVIVGTTRAHLDFDTAPGNITIYKGPLPTAGDTAEALKVQLINTPTFVHVDWNLGFPGGITFDTDSVLEVRLLTQDGSDRTVVDFSVGDLTASWGINVGSVSGFACKSDTGPPFFVPSECGTWLTIAEIFAKLSANPVIEGFVSNYQRVGSPSNLVGGPPPAPGANEWVPRLNFFVDNFTGVDVSVSIDLCVIPIPLVIPCLAPLVPVPHFSGPNLNGDFNFDFWDLGGGPLNFLGDPDYINNDPWDFWPLFHSQDNHLFPFGP